MQDSKRGFVPLDMSEIPLLKRDGEVTTKEGLHAVLPAFAKGQIVEFEDVRWEVVKISTVPPRMVLKPVGPVL